MYISGSFVRESVMTPLIWADVLMEANSDSRKRA